MLLLVLKYFHIIGFVSWFAGLFYLPRLFVYHTQTKEEEGYLRFCVMERKLYKYIMTPAMVFTLICGFSMLHFYGLPIWLLIKLFLIILLVIFHFRCGSYIKNFQQKAQVPTQKYFRMFNEIPTVLLLLIVFLAVFKNMFI